MTLRLFNKLNGNWDHPKAIKHDAFYQCVIDKINYYSQQKPKNKKNRKFYIILEGFMLFWDKRIIKCINHFIWIEIPQQICRNRREKTKPEPPGYFDKYIWPNHTKYKTKIFNADIKDKLV